MTVHEIEQQKVLEHISDSCLPLPDGFGIGYIIKDGGIQFSVSSKHRQTLRFVNMLEKTLMDLRRLLTSTSNVVCQGHHNHIIHPVRKEPTAAKDDDDDNYGDFYGESALEGGADNAASSEKKKILKRQESDGGALFANVTRKPSVKFLLAKNVGVQLSFDESVESASSTGSSGDGRAWYYGSKPSSSRSTGSASSSEGS